MRQDLKEIEHSRSELPWINSVSEGT